MAVTIQQNPQKFTPANNPVVFTFDSDQTAQPNFSFIVELYIETTLYSTHQVFPQFGILAKFNATEAIKSTLSSPLVTNGNLLTPYLTAFTTLNIIVYEQYGTPVAIGANATSNNIIAFNAALRHDVFFSYDYLNYNVSRANLNLQVDFLTSWPRARKYFCGLTEKIFLGFLTDRKNSIEIEYILYDATNTIITSYIYAPGAFNFEDINVLDASPATIIINTTITALDFAAAAYYTVRAYDTGIGVNPGTTESFEIHIDNECHQYETRRLHWLNKLGVWDSFTFTLVSTESTSLEGVTYEREKGVWDGNLYKYPLYQGEITTYSKRAEDTMILNSDWIYEEVQQWLVRECYESPNVYLESSSGNFEPVNIVNKNYTLKQRRKDGLIQEVVEIKKTYSYNSQLN